MEFDKTLRIGSTRGLEFTYERAMRGDGGLVGALIRSGVAWHCGGMSDPFQPCEEKYHVTRWLAEFTASHGINVLFSTKSDDLRGCEDRLDPSLHSFQLSVSNVDDRTDIEPNVPPIESRYGLYRALKDSGFRVGIRIQPFIPGISTPEIVDMFNDADHFTIEGLKLVPQNREHVTRVLEATGLDKKMFKQMGLLNLLPEIRLDAYGPLVERLEYYGASYSISDNDLHHIGTCRCCCGDSLVFGRSSGFDNTALLHDIGPGYTLDDVKGRCSPEIWGADASSLFTSNRTEGCRTVGEFFEKRFNRPTSPFCPSYTLAEEQVRCGERDEVEW